MPNLETLKASLEQLAQKDGIKRGLKVTKRGLPYALRVSTRSEGYNWAYITRSGKPFSWRNLEKPRDKYAEE